MDGELVSKLGAAHPHGESVLPADVSVLHSHTVLQYSVSLDLGPTLHHPPH